MRCRNDSQHDWKQVEASYYQESHLASLAFLRIAKSSGGSSQKVLTDSLRQMEADGIITRTVYPEVPPRVEYALSSLGESLNPIIAAMKQWGRRYKELAE